MDTNTTPMSLMRSAIHYGAILGAFWVFKYLFLMGATYVQVLGSVYSFLSAGTLIVFYWLLTQYRDQVMGGVISYGRSLLFGLLIFTIAAVPEMIITFVHYRFIDPLYTANLVEAMTKLIDEMPLPAESVQLMKKWFEYGDVYFVANSFLGNIVVGFFLSMICGIFVKRDKIA